MPTYEFRCPKGHDFEKFYRSIGTAPNEVHCPECGALAERQLSAGAGLVFKGSGFYITDYGKDGKKDQRTAGAAAVKSDGGTSENAGTGSSEKSDSGPSEKSDSGRSEKSDSGRSEKSDSGSAKSSDSGSGDSAPAVSSDKRTTAPAGSKASGGAAESKPASAPGASKKKDTK